MTGLTWRNVARASHSLESDRDAGDSRSATNLPLWLFRSLDRSSDLATGLAAEFSAVEWERACRYRDPQRRMRFLESVRGIRCILSAYLQLAPQDVPLSHNEQGAPRLLDENGRELLSLSISHSGNVTALLIGSPGRRIGIDIEVDDGMVSTAALARIALSHDEQIRFSALDGCLKQRALLQIWTAKEAVVKALGTGFVCPVDTILVEFEGDCLKGIQLPFQKELRVHFDELHPSHSPGERSEEDDAFNRQGELIGTLVELIDGRDLIPASKNGNVLTSPSSITSSEISTKLAAIGIHGVSTKLTTSLG